MSRPDVWIRRVTVLAVLAVAGIAAVVSYRHMHELAVQHGESSLTAALIPLSVDGMIVASSMSLLCDSRSGRTGAILPWALLLVGGFASLAANVAVAEPTLTGRCIAAWPSCALIGSYEMLMGQIRRSAPQRTSDTKPEPEEGRASEIGTGQDALTGGLQRKAWQWALEHRDLEGRFPDGQAIGTAFCRSARWGRAVKKAGQAGAFGQREASVP